MHTTTCDASPAAAAPRSTYLRGLALAFAVFNSIRALSYLPTVWAIHASGHSDQHSLLTWLSWLGANATMAAWVYEQNGHRADRVVAVSAANAVMCLATSAVIVWYRF